MVFEGDLMDHRIKVSIVVPVYNVAQYLSKCLDSLISQTLEEIEVIVVNDGSSDNSQFIIDDYVTRYPSKIHSFIKENSGLSDTRNYGIHHSRGEYIGFVDSDDYVDPNYCKKMYDEAVQSDAQIVVCGIAHLYLKRIINTLYPTELFNKSVQNSPRILEYANSFAWNKLFLRSFWMRNGFLFPKGQWFEDSALIYNVMLLANRVSCVNSPLYYYRHDRDDSITTTVDTRIFDVLKSCSSIVHFYKDHNAFEGQLYEEVEFVCLRHATARYRTLIYSANRQIAFDYVHSMVAFFEEYFPEWKKSRYLNPSKEASARTRLYMMILRNKPLMFLMINCPNCFLTFAKKSMAFLEKGKGN